jgi:hypothetical protein
MLQIDVKDIYIFHHYDVEKFKTSWKDIEKDTFPFLFTWESIKQISIWNHPKDDLWKFKLSYLKTNSNDSSLLE